MGRDFTVRMPTRTIISSLSSFKEIAYSGGKVFAVFPSWETFLNYPQFQAPHFGNLSLVVPEIRWLGVMPSEVSKYIEYLSEEALVALTDKDRNLALDILHRPCCPDGMRIESVTIPSRTERPLFRKNQCRGLDATLRTVEAHRRRRLTN
ncbi:hypothetical protein BV898_09710 [Hypsibius exemplaris]|uniref:Uncharacterized protein n=1 Tax=Hypsibius exemplaris TaxID=2072580 RepID=A0A1W0WM37_HYPEX|nr:hypothetical protein BV898_09710 [Hypsibius exemplaris]